jgi:hypothetical protein
MTKFEVTEQMVEAAIEATRDWRDGSTLHRHEPMRAAITAAIEASGILEENARLRSGIEGLAKIIRESIKENDGPDRVWIDGVAYEGPLADSYFKALRLIQTTFYLMLNKEPTL